MKAIVDNDACTACGLCAGSCPDVFRMGDSWAEVIVDPVAQGAQACAREAAAGCPVDAIRIEE